MNYSIRYFLYALVTVIIISCGGGEKNNEKINTVLSSDESVAKLESADLKDQKVSLNYSFNKGDKFSYRLTTTTTSLQEILADSSAKSEAEQKVAYKFDFEVIDVDQDKIAEINTTISSIVLTATIDNQKINYDSKKENSAEEKQKFIEYESITNQPFRIRINPRGEIIEVSRLDKIVEKLNNLSPQKQDLTPDQIIALAKNFGESAIRPVTQLIFREFGTEPILKNSTWEKSYPSRIAVFETTNTAKFVVEDFVVVNDEPTAKIKAVLSTVSKGEREGKENGMTYKFDEPKVTGGGNIFFGIESGRLFRSETTTKLELNLELNAPNALQKMEKSKRKEVTINKNLVELI